MLMVIITWNLIFNALAEEGLKIIKILLIYAFIPSVRLGKPQKVIFFQSDLPTKRGEGGKGLANRKNIFFFFNLK